MQARNRRLAAAAAASIVVLACTGCSINAGGAAGVRVVDRFEQVEGVDDVAIGVSNNLPFLGSASVVVTVDDDATSERAAEIAGELGAFIARDGAGTITWSAAVDYRDLVVGVTGDRSVDDARLRVAAAYWAQGTEGVMSDDAVVLSADSLDDLEPAARRAQELAAHPRFAADHAHDVGSYLPPAHSHDRSADDSRTSSIADDLPMAVAAVADADDSLDVEFDVFDEVRSAYQVTGGRLSPGAVRLEVPIRDVDAAAELGAALAASTGLEVEITPPALVWE